MKKITLLIILMMSSLGFAQPTTSAPTPTSLGVDVKSIFSDSYTNISTVELFPNWGQGTLYTNYIIPASSPSDNVIKYSNLDYQGINIVPNGDAPGVDFSTMTKLHIDVWTPDVSSFKLFPIDNVTDQIVITLTPTLAGWNSYDIDLATSFPTLNKSSIRQFKIEKPGFAYHAENNSIYIDNLYFWKAPTAAGTPVIGALIVPTKNTGDAPFNLTDPTSDSPGAFTYISSNTAVATISGNTITVIGAGTSTITANQAASGAFLAGSVNANLVVAAVPTVAAPTPPNRNTADVISIFSNAYSNITIDNWNAAPIWYAPTGKAVEDVSIASNSTKKVKFAGDGFIGIDFSTLANHADLTTMEKFHIDIWTETATLDKSFNLKLSNFKSDNSGELNAIEFSTTNGSSPALPNPNPGTWISLDMPLSAWTAGAKNNIAQFIVTSNLGTVYFDNVYIYKGTALGTTKFEKSNISVYPNPATTTLTIQANSSIDKVSVYNLLGQEVIAKSPKSNDVTLDISNLQKGAYIVKTSSDGKTDTAKVLKK